MDRVLACAAWRGAFPQDTVEHINAVASDHNPIILRLHACNDEAVGARTFRYECMWETHTALLEVVRDLRTATPKGDKIDSVTGTADKLRQLSGSLQAWDRTTFGSVRRGIKKLKRELDISR